MTRQHGTREYPMLLDRPRKHRADGDYNLSIHLLDGATTLPGLVLDDLPRMAQALSVTGDVVVVEYDDSRQCLRFYSQDPWLRAGRLVARREDRWTEGLRREAKWP